MDIGKVIRQIRISKNLKQTAVAASVGISVTAYSDIERGKTNHITLLRLEQIAKVLAVHVSTIILEAQAIDNIDSKESTRR
jgi:transcriptional regulator with XRE-family HTH domain